MVDYRFLENGTLFIEFDDPRDYQYLDEIKEELALNQWEQRDAFIIGEPEQPLTLAKYKQNLDENLLHNYCGMKLSEIRAVEDVIGLLDEWIKYFEKLTMNTNPLGPENIDEVKFINYMRMGLKRFRGKFEHEVER